MTKRKPNKEALKHIKLSKYGDNEWSFEYPRLEFETLETLHEAIDRHHSGDLKGARTQLKQLIKQFPEFIDAYHHLALLLDDSGQPYEAFKLIQSAVDLGLSSLPSNFYFGRDLLPWMHLDNRPFLRVYHYLGLQYLEIEQTEKALFIFNNILDVNPNDNQGIRSLGINCYLELKRPLDVLRIVEKYPDDAMADTLYGKVLALFQLERIKEAKKALKEAVKVLPLVAQEISKKRHRKPRGMQLDYITLGGEDEAYYFWQQNGKHWQQTPGAEQFLSENLPGLQ
ncbi:MAG: hypothetical protein PVH87_25500 [Desulfobacteraceae bacterium]|jgi:tetratricopeptide (TPR) repeat protein